MNVAHGDDRSWLATYAERMLEALRLTTHPDGGIALLNDSAFSVYPGLAELTGIRSATRRQQTTPLL